MQSWQQTNARNPILTNHKYREPKFLGHGNSIMRLAEISPPKTHPHVITIRIDPVQFAQFERLTGDRDEVRLLRKETGPDLWTLHIACASEEVARQMEDGWG